MKSVRKWVDPEKIILDEVIQAHKDEHSMFPYMWVLAFNLLSCVFHSVYMWSPAKQKVAFFF